MKDLKQFILEGKKHVDTATIGDFYQWACHGEMPNGKLEAEYPGPKEVAIILFLSITRLIAFLTCGSAKNEYAVSVGDTLSFYSRYTESDQDPDVGEASQTYVVTEEDLQNGFSVTMDLYVTENGGRNNGKSAHFVVTYTFSAK